MTEVKHSVIAVQRARDMGYSLRRHFVDDFHSRYVPSLPSGILVLDLGGNRIGKRGFFDIERFGFRVVYANLSTAKKPDVQADAACLPFSGDRFDAVICSELLEHVPDPIAVLVEINRVLMPGGTALICVPFMNKIHGDPYDYGRYTDYYWRENLGRNGFGGIMIERQGGFWSVLSDMLRDLAYLKTGSGLLSRPTLFRVVTLLMGAVRMKAVEWDSRAGAAGRSVPNGFTTGFGIRAIKQ